MTMAELAEVEVAARPGHGNGTLGTLPSEDEGTGDRKPVLPVENGSSPVVLVLRPGGTANGHANGTARQPNQPPDGGLR